MATVKFLYALIFFGLVLAGAWIYALCWGKPFQFNHFAERAMIEMTLSDPELISHLGIVDNTLLDFHSGKLTDISRKKNLETQKRIRKLADCLHRYDRSKLGTQEKLTYDILDHFIAMQKDSFSFGYGSYINLMEPFIPYPVNQMFGVQNILPDFMVNMHRIVNKKSAAKYVSRLSRWDVKFKDLIDELKMREQNGVVPPRFIIDEVLEEAKRFIQVPPHENMLFTSLKEKLQKFDLVDADIEQRALLAIATKVYPAYSELLLFLEGQRERATQDAGVWKFPNGDAFYTHCLSYHTTTNATPNEVHELGLAEVQRIQEEMRQILEEVGHLYREGLKNRELSQEAPQILRPERAVFVSDKDPSEDAQSEVKPTPGGPRRRIVFGGGAPDKTDFSITSGINPSVGDAMRNLGQDPRFLYPDTEKARSQVLADFHAIFDRIQNKLPQLFFQLPKGKLQIEPVPEYKAKAAPVAYYEPGDLKGLRPGVFYVNTHDIKSHTKFTMPTLAYHEGLPGHHLQVSCALELTGIPIFRRVVVFNAYAEGWALYCEKLASEYGFITSPYDHLGRLQYELLRAVRLVVDTGIHHKRWTREEAVRYMTETTGLGKREVKNEIDRYIVMPGQACGYKIGMIKLLELREKMKERQGDAFDIRAFHERVLQNGSMPLSILEAHLEGA